MGNLLHPAVATSHKLESFMGTKAELNNFDEVFAIPAKAKLANLMTREVRIAVEQQTLP